MKAALRVFVAGLKGMSEEGVPDSIEEFLEFRFQKKNPGVTAAQVLEHLEKSVERPNDGFVRALTTFLVDWDSRPASKIDEEAPAASTPARRSWTLDRLSLSPAIQETINARVAVYEPNKPVLISAETHEEWDFEQRLIDQGRYWPKYLEGLQRSWPVQSVKDLDFATSLIVSRLSDPERVEAKPTKGLVVGYVQSGKTANFTGVIAKAADCGYRLIIVLAGIHNILRDQTQRRLDKELIGYEILDRDGDYEGGYERELSKAVKHGSLPDPFAPNGRYEWKRLTRRTSDFRRLKAGITAIQLGRNETGINRFNRPENLHKSPAYLVVIKKNSKVVEKLVSDLVELKTKHGYSYENVPALIIDDESDQAGVNILKAKSKKSSKPIQIEGGLKPKERTVTNQKITDLIGLFPRGQYLAYTATPYANVFIDPDDSKDLFPADYIIALDRPIEISGYMGAADFYDFDYSPGEGEHDDPDQGPNQRRHVRDIKGEDEEPENLQQALDAYVLSGAVKLFRKEWFAKHEGRADLERQWRHHTMMAHVGHTRSRQAELCAYINGLFSQGGYLELGSKDTGAARKRLEKLWNDDLAKFCKEHADESAKGQELPLPSSFEVLIPWIAEAAKRIGAAVETEGAPAEKLEPAIQINMNEKRSPNFEASEGVWKILVGGNKLSRGYTVEGLTVTYYRRAAKAADSLMQMGRWFGFRNGYRDLVRLYIGREEKVTARKTWDLYRAFELICLDEEDFREQIGEYAEADFEKTPKDIPPLVRSRFMEELGGKVVAPGRAGASRILRASYAGRSINKVAVPWKAADVRANAEAMEELLKSGDIKFRQFKGQLLPAGKRKKVSAYTVDALCTFVDKAPMRKFLAGYLWENKEEHLGLLLKYLDGLVVDPQIDRWLVLAPQRRDKAEGVWSAAGKDFKIRYRNRTDGGKGPFNVFSEPTHKLLAKFLAGGRGAIEVDEGTKAFREKIPKTAIMLFYPVVPKDKQPTGDNTTMGFVLQFPGELSKATWLGVGKED